jgi:hypothetical protein
MTQLSLSGCTGIVLSPDYLDEQRGAWCTPKKYAHAVGTFVLDPFSNYRSHIIAALTCELERGDDGFGLGDPLHVPGSFYTKARGYQQATNTWRTWIQPDYEFVLEAIAHYRHTRFTALLRMDPSTEWFGELHEASELILIPKRDRIEFDPPPGVKASSNPFPHGFFYRHAEDATQEIRDLCFEWRLR